MSHGLRIWNSSGQLILEITDRIGRYNSTVTLSAIAPRGTASYSVPGYALDGTWFFFIRSGSTSYLRITENAGSISVFNENYYNNAGAGVVIDIFRG